MALRIGIDTGGTFTDLVGFDDARATFVYGKQASTPETPSQALAAVLHEVDAGSRSVQSLVVGTTVATNAVLQRRGARVLYVTTAGFEDVPFIGRLDKEELYNLHWRKPDPIVSRHDCHGIAERVAHDGAILEPLTESALDALMAFVASRRGKGAEVAVAVCLLFAYLAPEHELRIKERLQRAFPDLSVSVSHEVSPTWREYERASTTIGAVTNCALCGRLVPRRVWQVEFNGRELPFCNEECDGLYRSYWLPKYGQLESALRSSSIVNPTEETG